MGIRRKMTILGTCSLISLGLTAVRPAAGTTQEQADVIPGQYIVTLLDNQPADVVAAEHSRRHGVRLLHVYNSAATGYAATMSPAAARQLLADRRVEAVTPDRRVRIAGQVLPTGVDRVDADLSPTAKIDGADEGVDADIAVLDTGIDPAHPDLRVVGGKSCIRHDRGFVDLNGHGTHVAGIAAARDNDFGVVGVAPGARLWAVKVLDQWGGGSWSSVICGIDWVSARARIIEVANVSFGSMGADGACRSDPLHRAICRSVAAGVTYTAAAGNKRMDASGFLPAAYDEVITVSALADFDGKPGGAASAACEPGESDDTFADFSNYGPEIDLLAPGYCIHSTALGKGYATLSGTSAAAPHAAGAAALYRARHPAATSTQVKAALQGAATLNWNTATDPDGTPDKLLSAASL